VTLSGLAIVRDPRSSIGGRAGARSESEREPEFRLSATTSSAIAEQWAARILAEREEAGYLTREREGRRSSYEVDRDLPLRHPVEQHRRVGELLALAGPARAPRAKVKE
jgi:hypothetical protein